MLNPKIGISMIIVDPDLNEKLPIKYFDGVAKGVCQNKSCGASFTLKFQVKGNKKRRFYATIRTSCHVCEKTIRFNMHIKT